MSDSYTGLLVLEDGSMFEGESVGADGDFVGEVVFNTSMTGYQEIITDPSYWGQMVVFTCPHIGNVGVNQEDAESRQPWVRAIIARRICETPSNWRAQRTLLDYLRQAGIPALAGVDTRRLTLILRDKGVLRGALSTTTRDMQTLLGMARNAPDMSTLSAVEPVSPPAAAPWSTPVPARWQPQVVSPTEQDPPHSGTTSGDAPVRSAAREGGLPHIVVIDCGVKHNIARHLASLGARVTLAPWDATEEEVIAREPDGVLISNGPGDPECVPQTIRTTRCLMERQVPILGICLGHQIIGLACGGRTYKLPFGHHAGNHPVQNLLSGAIEITAQNHNYAIDPQSLAEAELEVTHINLNDHTVEGVRHKRLPVWAVQYHPEASPGPHDSLQILREFVRAAAATHSKRHAGGAHA